MEMEKDIQVVTNEDIKKIINNVGKNVIFGNDITMEFYDNTIREENVVSIKIKKGTKLTIQDYTGIEEGEERTSIHYVTFTDECQQYSFEFQDQFITFNPEYMTQDVLDEGLTLLLIEDK